MCLFFVYLSMAYRVYSRSRVHMSIVSGIQRESGVFDNPIRSDCDRYIRVWTKSYFCFSLLSPPIFSGCRFDLATERDDRAIRLTGSGTGRGDRAIRLTGSGTGREKKTARKDETPTGESNEVWTLLALLGVSRYWEKKRSQFRLLARNIARFLCSFCDFRIYQSHCLYNRRYGKRF